MRAIPLSIVSLALCLAQSGSFSHLATRHDLFKARNRELFDFVTKYGYAEAIPKYRAAANDAKKAGDAFYSIRFLNNLGGCQIATYRFREALETLSEAKEIAAKTHDRKSIAGLNSNISSLFWQMGNRAKAASAADEAVSLAGDLKDVPRASLFSQLGTMRAEMDQPAAAEEAFHNAIEVAKNAIGFTGAESEREPGAADTLAWAWDSLAYARWKAGRIEEAETAAVEGFRIRKIFHAAAIDSSFKNLAAIRAAKGDIRSALHLMDEAQAALSNPGAATPAWRIYMDRGRIELQAGQLKDALTHLRISRTLARDWRVAVVPNDANRTSSEETLAELYESLIEAGNRLYEESKDDSLIRETFDAAEENRAASLRALLPQHNDWRSKLPARYYSVLGKIKSVETAGLLRADGRNSAELTRLRSDLERMEAEVGAETPKEAGAPLEQATRSLDPDTVLFSFQLGERESWLWAVTDKEISVHRLPSGEDLAAKVDAFQSAVEQNRPELRQTGGELYRALFGGVDSALLARGRWILLLDRKLFELPFPALICPNGKYLIEDHALQVASAALMLKPVRREPSLGHGFLGVGDPVYNLADDRAKKDFRGTWPALLTRANYRQGPGLARLWGTGREVEASEKAWSAQPAKLLEGQEASPDNFWRAAGSNPEIIHFATHILEGNEEPRSGWIALSLDGSGKLQYITPADILARAVSAKLVTLSGCSSGKAKAPSATGLMGLTRAWIAAGAGSVLATRWPTIDDDGDFFQRFYRNLSHKNYFDPASALRQASLEVLQTRGWRANPSFWGGYFLVGNN